MKSWNKRSRINSILWKENEELPNSAMFKEQTYFNREINRQKKKKKRIIQRFLAISRSLRRAKRRIRPTFVRESPNRRLGRFMPHRRHYFSEAIKRTKIKGNRSDTSESRQLMLADHLIPSQSD